MSYPYHMNLWDQLQHQSVLKRLERERRQAVAVYLDSFSGAAVDLKKGQRTSENVLAVLAKHPKVSTWDMSENLWLWRLIRGLKDKGLIIELDEPYPWHKFSITDLGRKAMRDQIRIGVDR